MLGADKSMQGRPGRIVMVSSVGGKFAAPFIGGYAASKHGLEGMSASLRRELMIYGIDVIIVGKYIYFHADACKTVTITVAGVCNVLQVTCRT